MIRLRQVIKDFGERRALCGLDLEIQEGEITAILGESGAGKTTLLNAVADLMDYRGQIEGAGKVSYLFQSPKLLPHLTAEQNVNFVLPQELWGKTGELLARVGLQGRESAYPRSLSGGERQRVAIARAFLFPHDTLLMDEPFSSLDPSTKKSLIELVTELWQREHKTVLFVTHDVHEAALLARRALVLKKGSIVWDGHIEEEYPRDFFRILSQEEELLRALFTEKR